MRVFRKRSIKKDPLEQLVLEFWRVNCELKKSQAAYNTTTDMYIECTVHDLNAKMAYRDVLLKEIRMHKVDWTQVIKLRGIEVEHTA